MARIRTIKPEFPQSESMGRVSRDARLLFIQLWTLADDSGRLRGNSRMLASLLFPYDDDAPELIDGWFAELEENDCAIRYQTGGNSYIQICKWLIHQKIDKPSPSKIPEFDEPSRILAKPRERSSEDQGSRTKDQGRDQDGIKGEDQGSPLVEQNPLDLQIETIFGYWQKVMDSPKSALDKKRISLIKTALKNYSPADICKAIRGCSKTPHNMGKNDRNTKFNGLDLILRSAEKIDYFIRLDDVADTSAVETITQRNERIMAEVCGTAVDLNDLNTIDMEAA